MEPPLPPPRTRARYEGTLLSLDRPSTVFFLFLSPLASASFSNAPSRSAVGSADLQKQKFLEVEVREADPVVQVRVRTLNVRLATA